MESTEEGRIWHSDPPPHIGWWNASAHRNPAMWRWWDGEMWSCPSTPGDHIDAIEFRAGQRAWAGNVQWNDYYPKNARVPRVDPYKEARLAQIVRIANGVSQSYAEEKEAVAAIQVREPRRIWVNVYDTYFGVVSTSPRAARTARAISHDSAKEEAVEFVEVMK